MLLKLKDKVEWRLLPPVHVTGCELVGRVPSVGDVTPDYLVDIHLLAAGRSARRLVARDVVGVRAIHDLLALLPLVFREFERPEPTTSLICSSGGVDAIRAGIM